MLGAHRDGVPYLCGTHGVGNSPAGRARGRGEEVAAEPRDRRQPSVARSRTGDRWQCNRDDLRTGRSGGENNKNGSDENNEATRTHKVQGGANRARARGRGLGIGVATARVTAQTRGKAS